MRISPTFWRKNGKFLRCFKEAFPIDTLFTHVSCVTMDESMAVLTDAFVGITDGKITHLSKIAPPEDDSCAEPPEEEPPEEEPSSFS